MSGPLVEAESGVGHEEHPHSSFLIGIGKLAAFDLTVTFTLNSS